MLKREETSMPKKRSSTKVRKGVTKGVSKKIKKASAPTQSPGVGTALSVLDGSMKPLIRNAFLNRGS